MLRCSPHDAAKSINSAATVTIHSHLHHFHHTSQTKYLPSWASTIVPHLDLTCHPLTYIFINDIAITFDLLLTHLPPDVAGTPTVGTIGGAHTVPTIAQWSYNHLAILKHHKNNNEHNYNNIQNIQLLFRYSKINYW